MHIIECPDIWCFCVLVNNQHPGWMGGDPKQQPKQPKQQTNDYLRYIYIYHSVSLHTLHIVVIDFLLRTDRSNQPLLSLSLCCGGHRLEHKSSLWFYQHSPFTHSLLFFFNFWWKKVILKFKIIEIQVNEYILNQVKY